MATRTETVAWTETQTTTGATIRQGTLQNHTHAYLPILNPRETGGEHIGFCTQIIEENTQIRATVEISDQLAGQLDNGERVLLLDIQTSLHPALHQHDPIITEARAVSLVVAKPSDSAWPQHKTVEPGGSGGTSQC